VGEWLALARIVLVMCACRLFLPATAGFLGCHSEDVTRELHKSLIFSVFVFAPATPCSLFEDMYSKADVEDIFGELVAAVKVRVAMFLRQELRVGPCQS
jgi:hypothetical protein